MDLRQLVEKQKLIRSVLPSLVCPLTHEVMREPVCASDGYTYNRRAIEQYFARSATDEKQTVLASPMTGRRLESKQLIPNMVMQKQLCYQFRNLPLPQAELSTFERVSMYRLELILSFLDPRLSLSSCLAVNAGFFAVASSAQVSSPQRSPQKRRPSLRLSSKNSTNSEVVDYLMEAMNALVAAEMLGKEEATGM
jgi:hypothetical protein